MGTNTDKEPCPICGGINFDLLPLKIEGTYICDDCRDKIDVDLMHFNQLTLQSLQEYMIYYKKIELLQKKFIVTESFDFGLWNAKMVVDNKNKLFCFSKKPNKTIFKGEQLISFVIKEDNTLLFEGSKEGIYRFTSNVTERLLTMGPQLERVKMNNEIHSMLEQLGKEYKPYEKLKVAEPFQDFVIEIFLEHPYWSYIKIEMEGPKFDTKYPDVKDYIINYQISIKFLENLVNAWKQIAFEVVEEEIIELESLWGQPIRTIKASTSEVIEEIKLYKELLKKGFITEAEFEIRKNQLLRII